MAPAAVLSLEDTRQPCAKTRARHHLQADVDVWVETLEAPRSDAPPSLAEVTPAVCARRQEWTGRITDGRVAQRPAHVLQQRTWACPHGPRLLAARPAPPRTVPPMGGAVCLARPSCDGMPCQPGCAPVDEARQRAERRTPGDRQQAGARWAAEVPVETAQERCAEGPGLSWSEQPGQEGAGALRHAWGVLEVSPTAAELAPRVAESAAGTTWRPVVGGASAGALVPTRPAPATGAVAGRRHTRAQRASWPGAGQEAQGLRFSRVERARLVPRLSGDPVHTDAAVGAALRRGQEAGLIPAAQGRRGVRGDGAPWSWTQLSARCPTAVQSLDDDHGRAQVHQGASRPVGEDTGPEPAWVEALRARRCWGSVPWASEGVAALPPRESPAAEAIRKRMGWLRNTERRRHDRTARQGGSPLGSGGIEAANKGSRPVR